MINGKFANTYKQVLEDCLYMPHNDSFPLQDDFIARYKDGKSQILYKWIASDLNTPVAAYLKLSQDQRYSFLLESVEGGAILGRYSAIGLCPDYFWRYENGIVSTGNAENLDWVRERKDKAPLDSLQEAIESSRIDSCPPDLPPMAAPGLYGYLGYDMVRLIEDIPANQPDTLGIPEGLMMRPTVMVIFDNVKQMALITVAARPKEDGTPEDAYNQALQNLEETIATLAVPIPDTKQTTTLSTPLSAQGNVTQAEYETIVRTSQDYIRAGDVFQIVPSIRFSADFDLPPFSLYRALRRLNPSPFLFHLQLDDFALVGSSPEILVRVRNNEVTVRPIAGTRRRGETPAEDRLLAEELLADPKERAEHLMLLDLGRNDVGRVAEIGSVNVTERFVIEHYSHVMHIVSNVTGNLAADKSPLDALFSGFPAGTVSGAPKVRAMELLDELEPEARRFYGGCVGYFDGNGDIDSCIALRTALVKDGKVYVQAGAGVVADSDPALEYEECCNKAKALIHAAETAIEDAPSS